MRRELWILATSAGLLLLTLTLLLRGCRCAPPVERFVDKPALSPEEHKLFEELKGDKYTPKQVDDMVAKGVIDAKLVEKFLGQLEATAVPAADKKKAA